MTQTDTDASSCYWIRKCTLQKCTQRMRQKTERYGNETSCLLAEKVTLGFLRCTVAHCMLGPPWEQLTQGASAALENNGRELISQLAISVSLGFTSIWPVVAPLGIGTTYSGHLIRGDVFQLWRKCEKSGKCFLTSKNGLNADGRATRGSKIDGDQLAS